MTTDHNSPTSHAGHATPTTPQNALINLSYVALGTDPATSVTDPFGHTHDISGLWIADSSTWVTSGGVNPAATQAALALRTADRLLQTNGGAR
jgi:choline dehydrogenase-like flavoprotein